MSTSPCVQLRHRPLTDPFHPPIRLRGPRLRPRLLPRQRLNGPIEARPLQPQYLDRRWEEEVVRRARAEAPATTLVAFRGPRTTTEA